MLLKTMVEQFISSTDNIIEDFELIGSGGLYHFYNTEYAVTMTVITDAPFRYSTLDLLALIKAKCVKMVKVTFTPYGG